MITKKQWRDVGKLGAETERLLQRRKCPDITAREAKKLDRLIAQGIFAMLLAALNDMRTEIK